MPGRGGFRPVLCRFIARFLLWVFAASVRPQFSWSSGHGWPRRTCGQSCLSGVDILFCFARRRTAARWPVIRGPRHEGCGARPARPGIFARPGYPDKATPSSALNLRHPRTACHAMLFSARIAHIFWPQKVPAWAQTMCFSPKETSTDSTFGLARSLSQPCFRRSWPFWTLPNVTCQSRNRSRVCGYTAPEGTDPRFLWLVGRDGVCKSFPACAWASAGKGGCQ